MLTMGLQGSLVMSLDLLVKLSQSMVVMNLKINAMKSTDPNFFSATGNVSFTETTFLNLHFLIKGLCMIKGVPTVSISWISI